MKFHEAIAAGIKHIQENKRSAGLSILGIFVGIIHQRILNNLSLFPPRLHALACRI